MGSVDIIGTLDHNGMVLKTYKKLCVTEPDFLRKIYLSQKSLFKNPYKFPYQHWKDFE